MKNVTLNAMEVEEWIAHFFVNGTYVSPEPFQVHMLNQILVQAGRHNGEKDIQRFMVWCYEDAETKPDGFMDGFHFPRQYRDAYTVCMPTGNTLVALSLLRLARLQQLYLAAIRKDTVRYSDAEAIMADWHAPDHDIFQMDAAALGKRLGHAEWWSGEYANATYALQDDLLDVARLMRAGCFALGQMVQLYDKDMRRRNLNGFLSVTERQLEKLRYQYLFRQTQVAMFLIGGGAEGPYGMEEGELSFLHIANFEEHYAKHMKKTA